MKLGFIGLGSMGAAMALNLLRAGHQLCVWNRSPDAVAKLAAHGAVAAATPAEAFASEVVLSMLADDTAVRGTIDADVLRAAPAGAIHVNLATISVDLTRELERDHRAAGLFYVAAPVFGRPNVAAAAQLKIVVAGDPMARQRVQPLLEVIGQRTWQLGDEPERAAALKLAGNFMIASALETMAETAALAQRYDVSFAELLEILTGTVFAEPFRQNYGMQVAERRFEPAGFRLRLGLKDVDLVLRAGQAVDVPLPLASLLRDNLLDALAHGDGDLDWTALTKVALRRSGLE